MKRIPASFLDRDHDTLEHFVAAKNRSFGEAVQKLRLARGLTQKEIAARISTYYSDERSYRRVERGDRKANREAAIAILVHGLVIRDRAEVDLYLALAGYEGLTASESASFDLASAPAVSKPLSRDPVSGGKTTWRNQVQTHRVDALTACAALVVSGWICSGAESGPWYPFGASILYASLYAESLLLESVYAARDPGFFSVATWIFSMMLLTSAAGLLLDAQLTRRGTAAGLIAELSVFLIAAITQWFLSLRILSARTIVPTRHLSHTAQAAHLKNTFYFLLIAFLFWGPPAHAIAWLRIQRVHLRVGLPESWETMFLVVPGGVAPGVRVVWIALALMVIISLAMRGQLLDQLKTDAAHGRYLALFYLRAAIYFSLCILCCSWYTLALARFPSR